MSKLLFDGPEWSFPLINDAFKAIEEIGVEELGLDCYPNQLEVINSEQMLDIYATSMPISYRHWSHGKASIRERQQYEAGKSGLAYEVVFNTNPCINYLMESNTMTMQALVIAHAAMGHNSFFKGNCLFRDNTDAASIIDYLIYARNFIEECEQKHGAKEVESLLDSCHALKYYSVDRCKRAKKPSKAEAEAKRAESLAQEQRQVNALWDHLIVKEPEYPEGINADEMEPEENILYYLEKNAPNLKTWQREVIRIVRKIAQYFYPQYQTQLMNEGWASTCHYYIMTRLMEKGQITEGSYMEFLHSHTGVCNQQMMSRRFNPYWMGFNMYAEIKRVCQFPTEEDGQYFPDLAGSDWKTSWLYAMKNFRDESFISQYLTPKLVREKGLFLIDDDSQKSRYEVQRIQDARGFEDIRSALSDSYKLSDKFEDIQIVEVDRSGDRSMTLKHTPRNSIKLDRDSTEATLHHIENIWGYPVTMYSNPRDGGPISRYSTKDAK